MTQARALEILKTGANVFLTGEPGAGKTHTINEYIWYLRSSGIDTAVTASTGIAATHLSGMTIHSWSGIGIKPRLSRYDLDKLATNEYLVKRIAKAKVLIIDEVSMLAPDTVTMVDQVCREVRMSPEPFGGLQIIFVGDFFQLPPVVRENLNSGHRVSGSSTLGVKTQDEFNQEVLFEEGSEVGAPKRFAYSSQAWSNANPITCYLTEQHRQDDADFLNILSAIRKNAFTEDHLLHIVKRKISLETIPAGIPKLYSHNVNVDAVNEGTLKKIKGDEKVFMMQTTGKDWLVATLKRGCLSPESLTLKVGAEVMFTKNKPKDGFVNGTLGTVESFSEFTNNPIVKTKSGQKIEVGPMDWTVEDNGKIKASLTQLPLRLAWAITVHKSQGMSMDSAVMDLAQVFEYGQGYVALSRVRRLAGLHILGWNERAFEVHPEVLAQDEAFRISSEEAEEAFGKLSPAELEKMQDNFIMACGGKMNRKLKVKSNKLKVGSKSSTGKLAEIREKHSNAYRPWDESQEKTLKELFEKEIKMSEIGRQMGRKPGAIRMRLEKMGLIERV